MKVGNNKLEVVQYHVRVAFIARSVVVLEFAAQMVASGRLGLWKQQIFVKVNATNRKLLHVYDIVIRIYNKQKF